jgi:hypothetical protein
MVEIAHHSYGFALFQRAAGDGWLNFKLVASGGGKKRNWSLGWNGERLSAGKDTKLLQEHEPEICEWVVAVLTEMSGRTLHTHTPL